MPTMEYSFGTFAAFAKLATRDFLGMKQHQEEPSVHLSAAVDWLRRAHDHALDDGVSYGYSVRGGWRPSYRETSGYIATTFFDLARHFGHTEDRDRALRICRWLLSVQNEDGSFANPRYGDDGIVFDTGQVLFGLVRAFEETGEASFGDGAVRAANWLVNIADKSGRWTRNEHLSTPHVYNTRTAWALLRMNQVEHRADRERIARANLDWAVAEQQTSGFFNECAFKRGLAPFTHTIAYAARGLLESGELLNDDRYIGAAQRCADAALLHLRSDGFLTGQIAIDGTPAARYCCLTGNCQFSIVWARLFAFTGDDRYRRAMIRALDYVMGCQDIRTPDLNIRGGIKGSQPVWGRYAPLSIPNWPAKFFVDAMLLTNGWQQKERVRFLNADFDSFTLEQTVDGVFRRVDAGQRGWLCTVNVAILMMMRSDKRLRKFVENASIVVADGQPIVWCASWFGPALPERVTGVDLVDAICERAARAGKLIYLLGATPEIVAKLAQRLRERHPSLRVEFADGYFNKSEAQDRADRIHAAGADILFVGMGVPRQEVFIEEQWDRLGVGMAIGVGGSFDVLAGLRSRAPVWIQKLGMEWFYRMIQEPRRLLMRYLTTNSQFVWAVISGLFRKRRMM